jgi:hypothetical protein
MLREALLAYLFVTAGKVSTFANILIEPLHGIEAGARIDLETELSFRACCAHRESESLIELVVGAAFWEDVGKTLDFCGTADFVKRVLRQA